MTRKDVTGALRAACICQLADFAVRIRRGIENLFQHDASAPRNHSRVHSRFAHSRFVEPLEGRQLLSGVTFANGILTVSGADGQNNTLTVTLSGSNITGHDNGVSKTVAKSSVSKIMIYGGNESDTIRIDAGITIPSYIDGHAGNDYISGGGGNDTVWGDVGNDTMYGNGGNDQLHGEAGNDLLDGGAGTNTADGGTGTNSVKVSSGSTSSSSSSSSSSSTSTSNTVTSLELWNTDTQTKIETVTSGMTLDLAKLPAHLSLVAIGSATSVKFALDSNASYHVDNNKPWGIAGDGGGKAYAWTVPTGSHTVKVTPYTKTGATGTAGAVKTYTLNITRSSTSTSSSGSATAKPPTSTGSSTTGIVPRDNSAATPNAVISAVSSKSIHAGQSIDVNALSSSLGAGTPITARYVWNFGDSGSDYNTLEGFNAAHVYKNAGTYTVTLTLTNEAGKTDTATATINVAASGRTVYYVSNEGSDSNSGTSTSASFKTWDKAKSKLGDNVEILFKAGETFTMTDSMTIYHKNVMIGSYGSGRATIYFNGGLNYVDMIYLGGQGSGEDTVENLTFDSKYTGTTVNGVAQAVGVGGTGDAVLNCQFLNVDYGVNAQAGPSGLLVQGNTAPLRSGVKEYFVWAQGNNISILGNNVSNTLYGHDIRSAGTDNINISYNYLANPNDPQYGDNVNRGTINIHKGSYLYAAHNTFTDGVTSIGPLNLTTGLDDKSARMNYIVFEDNTINDSFLLVMHGTNHIMIRNNIINRDGSWAIELQGYNDTYARGIVDATIVNNTAVNHAANGNFLRVDGPVDGINLINNLYVAPNLYTGTLSTSPVYVAGSDLSSFNKITGNVWPSPTIDQYAQGGINYVWPTWSNAAGYKTAAEWNAYGVVGTDYFSDISISGSDAPSTSSIAASVGGVWAGVFTDINGKMRSNSGSWTAGAVEV